MIFVEKRRLFVLCSAALATVFISTCGGLETNPCGTAGCTSGAWLHVPLAVSMASQPNMTVTACKNTECYTSRLPALPAAGGAGTSMDFSAVTFVLGTLYQNSDHSIGLDIEWHVDDASLVTDGDQYVVTLTSAAGSTTTLLDKTATYQTLAPNGPTCAPVCSSVALAP